MEQRLQDLDFSLSGVTPQDGNCMIHCLLDQMNCTPGLEDFADSHQDLRWKVCNYGYDMFLRTGKLSWSFDPEVGTPMDWKKRMFNDGCWGDEVFLHLASNILQADLVIVPAFRESSVHQGLGFTLIKSFDKPKHEPMYLFVFSESDFSPAHYQSIRPNQEENVILTNGSLTSELRNLEVVVMNDER